MQPGNLLPLKMMPPMCDDTGLQLAGEDDGCGSYSDHDVMEGTNFWCTSACSMAIINSCHAV